MAEKRHLPVIGASASAHAELDAELPRRSAALWIVLGAVLSVVLSMPLSMLGLWVGGALVLLAETLERLVAHESSVAQTGSGMMTLAPLLIVFALASYAGCFVAVRYGQLRGRGAPILTGLLGGGLLGSVAAAAQGALSPWPLWAAVYSVLLAVGGLAGLAASRFGRKSSKPATLKGVSTPGMLPTQEASRPHEPH